MDGGGGHGGAMLLNCTVKCQQMDGVTQGNERFQFERSSAQSEHSRKRKWLITFGKSSVFSHVRKLFQLKRDSYVNLMKQSIYK